MSEGAPVGSEIPTSTRSTLRRKRERGSHERTTIDAILDEGLVCHVGIYQEVRPEGSDGSDESDEAARPRESDGSNRSDRPHGSVFVVPTAYARVGDAVYLHGAAANRTLRALADGATACLTVTLVDGLVLSRSAFHHSMNYRSVMLFGTAEKVTDPVEKRTAVLAIVEHMVPGRAADTRPPTTTELQATLVVRFPITDGSAKVRRGGPIEEDDDLALGYWAGELPFSLRTMTPVPDAHVPGGAPVPAYLLGYTRGTT